MEQLGIATDTALLDILAFLTNPLNKMLFTPLFGIILIMLTPARNLRMIRFWAVAITGLVAAQAILLITGLPQAMRDGVVMIFGQDFKPNVQYLPFAPGSGLQFTASQNWMKIVIGEYTSFSVNYQVGVDGLSFPLLLMCAFVMLLVTIWALHRTERIREFFALLLLLEIGLLGVFVATDLILLYLFWELMLIPMYLLITGWGRHKERAARAGIKFFIYTIAGSVFMLITFIILKMLSGVHSFDVVSITESSLTGMASYIPFAWRTAMFVGLLIAFGVKVPMFPFHTWLPDAHTEAPTEMSVILAAVMLKTGAYGFLRVLYPMFPDVAYQVGPIITFCALAAIVYGAAITLVQTDLKRMVAYSSISHMGFIVLGISSMNSTATVGAVFHMIGHAVVISTLFLMCGVIERRYGTRDLRELAGMWRGAPSYSFVLAIAAFAGMGLPGLVGFWGEFLVLKGTFFNNPNWETVHVGLLDGSAYLQLCAVIASVGIVIGAVYMINMLQRVLPGEAKADAAKPLRGLRLTDALVLIPLVLATVALGLYPSPLVSTCLQFANNLWYTQLLK